VWTWLTWTACGADPVGVPPAWTGGTTPLTATTSRCPPGDARCIDVLTIPVRWRADDGFVITRIDPVHARSDQSRPT
jgi:hypothetical protein